MNVKFTMSGTGSLGADINIIAATISITIFYILAPDLIYRLNLNINQISSMFYQSWMAK